ncbi:hypothetical protein K431DRAFT_85514 [Polychaeton citri CBS 116435]|uniref:Myb-like domain-containing protein n=1 Tax=Polychaeton citri CBS 116435 TaxID=1314669 RepID=A0A9P4Q9K8_9PEZI|nr:hypothetical protein K431DRAFT_85514 [Polychaeton citri CBS 116435]
MTPYPSSTVESQPFTHAYARPHVPDINISSYALLQGQGQAFLPHDPQQPSQQQQQQQHQHQHHLQHHQPQTSQSLSNHPHRPRSSPSTFGPAPDSLQWASNTSVTTGLGIQYSGAFAQPTPATGSFPQTIFQPYPVDENYTTSSPPELRQPQPRRPTYTNIAPNPAGLALQKRRREEDEEGSSTGGKRRKRTSSVVSADLSEDDRFLVRLKEEDGLPWKDIATRFQTEKGKTFQVAALQMRYKRLREKFRVWEDRDIQALKLAHEHWEKYKWEIIASKMGEYGIQERWPPRHCAKRWQEMEASSLAVSTSAGITPMTHFTSSPIEGQSMHFGFMPTQ